MKDRLLQYILCPRCSSVFSLSPESESGDTELTCKAGHSFQIKNGIPVLMTSIDDCGQKETAESFSYKWLKFRDYGHEPVTWEANLRWFLDKYGWENEDIFLSYLENKKKILDAGCGTGRDIKILSKARNSLIFGVDISDAVFEAENNVGHFPNVFLIQSDLNLLPFPNDFFDFIHSEGVIHHTPHPKNTYLNLVKKLQKGGEIQLYIYNQKGLLREIMDNNLRNVTTKMSSEECFRLSKEMALLGKYFSMIKEDIVIEQDLPSLGIKVGTYNLQRFIYYNMLKCFYNKDYGLDLSAMVNFDWYHPTYAFRFSPGEIKSWVTEAGLKMKYFKEIPSALVFRAAK